ncbi:MAG TPA: MFS transporter [Steroidobacteraceae bacterium]|nr:MFS transporter [Steroidobacteraceae bacterium]
MVRRRLLLALSFIAFISLGLPDGLLGVAWPSMRQTFALPLDALGSLFISTTLGYVTASFASGAILRHIRLGSLLALSCALTACALIAYSLAPYWAIVVAFGLLTGLGAGAIDSALNTFAAHNYSARTVNMLHAFYGLGTTIGPALMTAVLLANEGWQRGYLIVGIAQLVLAAGFVATRQLWPAEGGDTDAQTSRTSIATTLKLPATMLSIVVFVLYCGLEASTGAWLFTLLHEGRNVGTATAGTAVSVFWGSLMAARIVFGLVHVNPPLSRWLYGCMSAILIATLALSLASHEAVSIAAGALIGFACGPIFPWLIAETPQRLGTEHGANAIGVQISSAAIGLTLAPTILGTIGDEFGVNAIPFALLAIAALLLIAFWMLERCRRPAVS